MAAPATDFFPVGLRHIRAYLLNEFGVPKATSTTVYEGMHLKGAKAYNFTVANARTIVHLGDDRIQMQDVLPRNEASQGTLTVSRLDMANFAVLTGTKARTIGEAVAIGHGTDHQGNEPSIAVLAYQQAKDAATGTRRWGSYIIPSTQAIVSPRSMNEAASDITINLLPSTVEQHVTGEAFTEANDGFTSCDMQEFVTVNVLHICSWLADGTATDFDFHADRQAAATTKIHKVTTVSSAGVVTDVTGTVTLATDDIVFGVAPAVGTMVVCLYEYTAAA